MVWEPKTRTCPRSLRFRISGPSRSAGRSSGAADFLPASYQGTVLRWKGEPIRDLRAPAGLSEEAQRTERELLRSFNQQYVENHFTNPDLQARIDAYELAYRMQAEVPAVLDIDREPAEVREMYGLNDPVTESFGKRCLMARKLVEHGVRFVQLYTPSQSWDAHIDVRKNHRKNAEETDKPVAALVQRPEAAGPAQFHAARLDGGVRQNAGHARRQKTKGRDHNPRAMSMWFAGGGIQGRHRGWRHRRSGPEGCPGRLITCATYTRPSCI